MADDRFVRKLNPPNWIQLDEVGWNAKKEDIKRNMQQKKMMQYLGMEVRDQKKKIFHCKARNDQQMGLRNLHFVRIHQCLNVHRGLDVTADGNAVGFSLERNSVVLVSVFEKRIPITRMFHTPVSHNYRAISAHPHVPGLFAVSIARPPNIKVLYVGDKNKKQVSLSSFNLFTSGVAVSIDWSPTMEFGLAWGSTSGYLMRSSKTCASIVRAGKTEITSVKFSPSGAYLASYSGLECVIRIWSGHKLRLLFVLPEKSSGVMAWHPTSPNVLATSSLNSDGLIQFWKCGKPNPLVQEGEITVKKDYHSIAAMSFNPATSELFVVSQMLPDTSDLSAFEDEESRVAVVHVLNGEGKIVDTCSVTTAGDDDITQVIWNPDGSLLGVLAAERITILRARTAVTTKKPQPRTTISPAFLTTR